MIVLHAICDSLVSGTLHIWAEFSDAPFFGQSEISSAQVSTRKHPFVLPHAALREALGDFIGGPLLTRAEQNTISLRLPSTAKAPTHSPELLVEAPLENATGLKWWDVEALTFRNSLMLDLLLALPDNAPYDVAYGSSLRFWITVAKFAFELLTKQSFVPTLQETKQGRNALYQAVWRAFLSSEDTERMRVLTQAMPPLCWSFMPAGEKCRC